MGKLPADWKPHHEPYQLDTKYKREKIVKTVKSAIQDGLDVEEGFILAGIPKNTYQRWCRELVEDMEQGYTGTNLMNVMFEIAQEDIRLHRKLRKAMMRKAEEGDVRMLMYLEDNRFGAYNKRKNNIEVGNKSKGNVQINIVSMTGVEADDEEEIEEIEVHGESRDDSDSAEMD